jgi:hypothetical protein
MGEKDPGLRRDGETRPSIFFPDGMRATRWGSAMKKKAKNPVVSTAKIVIPGRPVGPGHAGVRRVSP